MRLLSLNCGTNQRRHVLCTPKRMYDLNFIFKDSSKTKMRPKECKPSHEAQPKSSFKTYLPNLTAFQNSSRRWTTGFVLKDLSKPKLCKPSDETHQTSSFKKYLPNLTAFKKSSRRWITGLFSRDYLEMNMRPQLCNPSHEAHQRSSFKTYLPNLTGFKKSSRRWITGFIFKDLSKK